MKTLFYRVFVTNWKTSGAALLVVAAITLRVRGLIDKDDMQYLIGIAAAAGLFAAKDGIREETVVAREDVPAASPEPVNPPAGQE